MRALLWDGRELRLAENVELRATGADEVRVRVRRAGICHSDINLIDNRDPVPTILGHEAAGEIIEVGSGVSGWNVGDAVIAVCWTPCGHCRECERDAPSNCDETFGLTPHFPYSVDGQPFKAFGNVAAFASEILVKPSQLFRTDGVPPEQAALVGCAVATGYGSVTRLGQVRAGDRVVVVGVGGIGVNAIQSAKLIGATVLAVDVNPDKAAVAKGFGADDFLLAERTWSGRELAAELKARFRPIDVIVECSGALAAIEAAVHGVKRNGRAVLIGLPRPGADLSISADAMVYGRSVVAELGGGIQTPEDIPRLLDYVREGRLDVASQITRVWPLAEAQEAIAALRAGAVTRAVLSHD